MTKKMYNIINTYRDRLDYVLNNFKATKKFDDFSEETLEREKEFVDLITTMYLYKLISEKDLDEVYEAVIFNNLRSVYIEQAKKLLNIEA